MNDFYKEDLNKLLNINLNLLLYLDVLLEERHVSRAAKRLNVSQPALSHALKELRRFFNDPLIIKGEKGWIVSQKASYIQQEIKEAFFHLNQALSPSEFNPKEDAIPFKVMMTDYAGAILLPKLMEILSQEAPNVTLDILPFRMDFNSLESVDAAVSFLPESVPTGFYEVILFEEYYVCMVSKQHPRLSNRLSLEQFLSEKHMVVREENGAVGVVNQALQLLGKKRHVVLEVPNFLLFPHIIATTELIITTTSRNAQLFMDKLPVKIFPVPLLLPTVPVKVFWHQRVEKSDPHKWLISCIERVAKDVVG